MAVGNKIPDPIFTVKKDIDIFQLYGSGKVVDDTEMKDTSDVDGMSDDLQSMRIRLAVMKAKEQCEEDEGSIIRQEAIDEVDSNLQEIIALESPFTDQVKPVSSKGEDRTKSEKSIRHTSKLTKQVQNENKDKIICQITSQINGITATFSKIFQALVVLIQEHNLNENAPSSSTVEAEKINKRSREFDVRLHRQIFEAKQKTIVLKGSMTKHQLHRNKKTRYEVNKSLYQSLRCYSSIINAYLNHLPLSGRHLFPSSLQALFDVLSTVAYIAEELNFERASQMVSDTHRLSAVFNQFQSKFQKKDEDYNTKGWFVSLT